MPRKMDPVVEVVHGAVAASARPSGGESVARRGSSPLVGAVVLVVVTVVLAAAVGAFVAFGGAQSDSTPQASFAASLDASDGWPDGQRLRIVHEGGDAVPVDEVSLLVTLERTGAGAKLSGFPTRRLTAANVDGTEFVDSSNAGVDGVLDAVHTDGRWEPGDAASVRIAQEDVDVRAGDRVRVVVCHDPSNAALARLTPTASG